MKNLIPVLGVVYLLGCSSNSGLPDISGDWVIASSVGGGTPITVYCSVEQNGARLTGSCTPEMANPEPSALTGTLMQSTAQWGYDVVFNGNPGRVDFMADSVSSDAISGTLSLSGTQAPFTAQRKTD